MKTEIAICNSCDTVIARDKFLPRSIETVMFCLDCGTLSRDFRIEETEVIGGNRVGDAV